MSRVGVIAMAGLLLLGSGGCGGPAASPGTTASAPKGQANYKGLFAGRSKKEDVVRALGKPALEKERDGDLHFFYPPNVKDEANWVRFDARGMVKEITLHLHYQPEQPKLAEFKAKYGTPDLESKTSFFSAWSRVVVFKKAGVELIVQNGDDRVLVVAYVDPKKCPTMAIPDKNPYTM